MPDVQDGAAAKPPEPLNVEGVLQALRGMQRKGMDRDKCCNLLRKWAADRRVTPSNNKVITPTVAEKAIELWMAELASSIGTDKGSPEAAPVQERPLPPAPTAVAAPPTVAAEPAQVTVEPSKATVGASKATAEPTTAAAESPKVAVDKVGEKRTEPGQSEKDASAGPASKRRKGGDNGSAADTRRGKDGASKAKAKADAAAEAPPKKKLTAKELREQHLREQRERQEEEERRLKELAVPFEGLSIEDMRTKRLAQVLEEMDGRMKEIAVRTAKALNTELPSEEQLASICGSGLGEDRREAYMRLIHTVREPVPVPEGLQAELMPHQVDGLEWLVSIYVNRLHGILADEMGLGKTLQSIALLQFLKEFKNNKGPHLIVAPKSTLTNWQSEFARFAPTYKVWLLVGEQEEREALASKLRKRINHDKTVVYITNYEQIHRNEWLQEFEWQMIIIDEGHRMKNQKSVLHETMTKMRCRTRMLLTGTPLQNNLNELWALLHYLLPELFTSSLDFQSWFLDPLRGVNGLNEYEVTLRPEDEALLISRLHTMLSPFLLQRTKAQVLEQQLPPKVEATLRAELSAWQRSAYEDLQKRTIKLLSSEDKVETQRVNNTLMQLRKIVLHPYLFTSYQLNHDLFRASGKVEMLDRMLQKLLKYGHKTLIFSQFTSALDVLRDFLNWRGWRFARLDGQTPHDERQRQIAAFSSPDGPPVFLLSARAGGLGLNLQAADTVILFDLDWNPQNDKQAVARAHRFGQQREVRVFRLLTTSSVELHMERRCREKLDLERKIIGAGMFSKGASQEQRIDLLRGILGLAADGAASAAEGSTEAGPTLTTTSPSELNRLLARGDEELAAFEALDAELLRPTAATSDGEEDFLVSCGRLMRPEEVPDGFRLDEDNDMEDS